MKADVKQELNALGMKVANYLNSNRLEHPVNQNIAAMFDYASTPGHKLRSGLVFLAAEAVGGEESKVLPAAAAVELLHKSTLIHDDIVDNDYYRRGMPAFHSKFGEDMGIVFGDFICAASFQLLKRLEGDFDRKTLVRCFGAFSSVFRDVYYGQLQDLQFEEKFDISEAEYMQMVGNKTGRLMNGALQIGAILGNGSDGEISKLSDFGYNFGIAFQIRNDINNLTLEKELRKDGGSDIRARKRTLMVIKTLNSQDKQKLMVIFGKNEIGEEDVNSVIELFNRNGSIKYAFLILKQHAKKAKDSLDNLPETRAKESLLSLVDYIETDTYWKTHSRNSY
jgi:geranylgeranyl diphosphate synthase, type I